MTRRITYIDRGPFLGVVLNGRPIGRVYSRGEAFTAHTNTRPPGSESRVGGEYATKAEAVNALCDFSEGTNR